LPWKGSFQQAWRLLIIGAIAASAGLFLFARPLVQILYGPEYIPAVMEGKILAWILIPFTANTFLSLSILANRKEQTVMRVQVAGLIVLIGLNALWIPKWGINGACLAMIAAEIFQVVLYLLPGQLSYQISKAARWWFGMNRGREENL
jgi:O-antigen/teichoic acid export membrane protein